MDNKTRKNLEAAIIIVVLGILYFVVPLLIWGAAGIAVAAVIFISAVALAALVGLVFCALNDTPGMGKSAPPNPPTLHRRRKDDE